MKRIKFVSVLIALAMMLTALSGCGAAPVESSQPSPESEPVSESEPAPAGITFTDMSGREISLDAPAEKIVALTAADVEILYAIGAGDTLVGRGEYCDYPAETAEVSSVQSGSETNIEQVISLAPQAVIMSTMDQTTEQIAALENAGIKVIVSDGQDIAGVYTAIEMIGALTGRDGEAAALVDSMKTAFADIEAKVSGDGSQTVYFEVSPLEYGLWTAGSGTFMDEIASMLGLTNAFADVEGWGEISEEQVIERDPDFIVSTTMSYDGGPDPVAEILARPGWGSIKAIAGGKVLNASNDEITRPGPRLADAAAMLYDFVYGA